MLIRNSAMMFKGLVFSSWNVLRQVEATKGTRQGSVLSPFSFLSRAKLCLAFVVVVARRPVLIVVI